MSLYKKWEELASRQRSQAEHDAFWKSYFEAEKENYENILENHTEKFSGKVSELAEKFKMDSVVFAGFLDGINTSLVKEINLEELEEDTEVSLDIDFEKLYYNMLDAKAEWLYGLEQWDGVLSLERRQEILKEFKQAQIAVSNKVGRNDACPCGSGKKYKKCCGK